MTAHDDDIEQALQALRAIDSTQLRKAADQLVRLRAEVAEMRQACEGAPVHRGYLFPDTMGRPQFTKKPDRGGEACFTMVNKKGEAT